MICVSQYVRLYVPILNIYIISAGKELTFLPKEAVENALEAEVTGVDLSKNYFEKFPGQLEPLMPQLYDLNLSSNRLDAIPSSLIGLGANLQYLNLANNKLSQLPPEVGMLANLREICLSCNRMDQVRFFSNYFFDELLLIL